MESVFGRKLNDWMGWDGMGWGCVLYSSGGWMRYKEEDEEG